MTRTYGSTVNKVRRRAPADYHIIPLRSPWSHHAWLSGTPSCSGSVVLARLRVLGESVELSGEAQWAWRTCGRLGLLLRSVKELRHVTWRYSGLPASGDALVGLRGND
jgi:hypothetical protein